MSLAPLAYMLFQRVMRHDPTDADWLGRDRFVLSCGHSPDPVHPAVPGRLRPGAGRPGGAAHVGVADPRPPGVPPHQRRGDHHRPAGPGPGHRGRDGDGGPPRARPVRPGRRTRRQPVRPLRSTCVASDGDIEEGVTSEASSIAGHQQLGNLIVIYDDNQISIEDDTDDRAQSEDVAARYEAYGWHVQNVDGRRAARTSTRDPRRALEAAKAVTDRPSFIQLRTIIAWPAPNKKNTGKAHGSALGRRRDRGDQGDPRLRPGRRPSRSTTR